LPIKVVVHGALGKVGQEVIRSIPQDPDVKLVGAVDLKAAGDFLPLPDGSGKIPLSFNLENILTGYRPDVVVDFTIARATMPAVRTTTKHGINMVIGTTGLSADDLKEIEQLSKNHNVGIVVAPNFALGAILMIHMARVAAKYLDYAEIIELHHHLKADSPSGTSLSTAKAMAQARGKPFSLAADEGKSSNSRGMQTEGIAIHSVRLPGLMAHQEVIFGGLGQTLSIRHDTISRECYIPGIILAIKEVIKHKGLVYGLDTLLGL
jgi:4-hydroxy-tetrahydrodipicolinate reductase